MCASGLARALSTVAACSLLAAAGGCSHHSRPAPAGPTQAGSLSYALERAAALADGIPVTPQALQAPLPPPDQNAAPMYSELARRIEARPNAPPIDKLSSNTLPSARQAERAGAALARCGDLLALLRQATDRPACVFVADWSDPNAVEVIKPEAVRSIARLLRAQSLVLASRHKPMEAVEWQARGFRLARHIAEQNWGFSDSYFVESSAVAGMSEILLIAGSDPRVAEAVRAATETGWKPRSLARSLKTRAGMNAVILEKLRAAGPAAIQPLMRGGSQSLKPMNAQEWDSFIDENGILMLRHSREIIAVADRPFQESMPVILAAEARVQSDNSPRHLLLQLMDEKFAYLAEQRATSIARAEIMRAAAAVLAWRGRHGSYPSGLAPAISPVPSDPFSGAALGYRRGGSGFVVYSVGRTGKFTGGSPTRKNDDRECSFRYPAPAYLKGPIRD